MFMQHHISQEKEILDLPPKQVLMIIHNSQSGIFRLIKSNEESYLEMVPYAIDGFCFQSTRKFQKSLEIYVKIDQTWSTVTL